MQFMRTLLLTVKDSGSESASRVEIPDDEMSALIAFADAADELAASGVLQQELHVHIEIKFDAKSVTFAGTLPDNDAISALLHRVRPFVLSKEPMSFLKIRNLLARRVENAEMRRILDHERDLFTGKDFQKQVEIVTSTPAFRDILNSDDSFHNWLNAFEYHRDPAKRAAIEQVCGLISFDTARALFISMLLDKVKAIMHLAVIIRRCDQADGRPLSVTA
jgi:hypothetical protein